MPLAVALEHEGLLSADARSILTLGGPDAYSALVVHGGGNDEGKTLLRALRAEHVLSKPVARTDAGNAVLSGLWLWHDWLDESHRLSQEIHSSTGSFLHAIMHRREGDFGNSKYWYARCRGHAAHARAAKLAEPELARPEYARLAERFHRGSWDGYALVDLAEETHRRALEDPARQLGVALQRIEWAAIFDETLGEAATS
jgi:hypothetical protein